MSKWIICEDRMPDNAYHKGMLCQRVLVCARRIGVTVGWYNPNREKWYGVVYRMGVRNDAEDISMDCGSIPCIMENLDVVAWMPLPKRYRRHE